MCLIAHTQPELSSASPQRDRTQTGRERREETMSEVSSSGSGSETLTERVGCVAVGVTNANEIKCNYMGMSPLYL